MHSNCSALFSRFFRLYEQVESTEENFMEQNFKKLVIYGIVRKQGVTFFPITQYDFVINVHFKSTF